MDNSMSEEVEDCQNHLRARWQFLLNMKTLKDKSVWEGSIGFINQFSVFPLFIKTKYYYEMQLCVGWFGSVIPGDSPYLACRYFLKPPHHNSEKTNTEHTLDLLLGPLQQETPWY